MLSDIFLAGLAVGCLAGIGVLWRSRRSGLDRCLASVCAFAAVLIPFLFLQAVLSGPANRWNTIRLTPTLSLLKGYPLYHGARSGPVTGHIYGPLAAVAYLPAVYAPRPRGMVEVGVALSLLFYFAPMAWLCHRRPAGEAPAGRLAGLAAFVLFVLLTFQTPGLRYVASSIHADSPALGLAGAACAVLYAYPRHGLPSLLGSALLAVLSIWSKQVMILVPIALLFWVLGSAGFRTCLRYLACLLVTGLVTTGLVLATCNAEDLFFNVVTVPTSHPWYHHDSPVILAALVDLGKEGFVLWVIVAFGALYPLATGAGIPRNLADWLTRNRWSVFVAVGLAEVPLSLLGGVKQGGMMNAWSHSLYFILAAVCLMFSESMGRLATDHVRAGLTLLCLLLPAASASLQALDLVERYAHLDQPRSDESEAVMAFLNNHPGEAYFPWNPLEHLLVDGSLYHFHYGVYDRKIAGFIVRKEHFREHIPPDCRLVCLPVRDLPPNWFLDNLKDFSRPEDVPELPDFVCFARDKRDSKQ